MAAFIPRKWGVKGRDDGLVRQAGSTSFCAQASATTLPSILGSWEPVELGDRRLRNGLSGPLFTGFLSHIQNTPHMRILVAVEPINFRAGIDGVVGACTKRLQADLFCGALFVG